MPISAKRARHILRVFDAGQAGHPVGLELKDRFELMIPGVATEITQGNDEKEPYQQEAPYPKIRRTIARIALQDDRKLKFYIFSIMRDFILFMMSQINVEDDLYEENLPDAQLYQYIRQRVDYYAGIQIKELQQSGSFTIDSEGVMTPDA